MAVPLASGTALFYTKTMKKRVLKAKKKPPLFNDIARTKMRVIGLGGGGSNIVSEISQRLKRSDFVAANTDLQALKNVGRNTRKFAFGQTITKGLGCGMDPSVGELAAEGEIEKIKKLLEGQDLCVLVATLGGGTGSGAAPVFADVSQKLKNLTLGIFTMPFSFEGEKRMQIAKNALEKLRPLLHAYVIIPNDGIFQIVDKKAPLRVALSSINKKLAESLEGFVETLFSPGLINIDFADVKALLQGRGRLAYLSSVTSVGEDRAKLALDQVLSNPLYDYKSKGAERILFNIAGSKDLKMDEVSRISNALFEQNPRAKIIFGISSNQQFQNKLRITVFAIGCQPHASSPSKQPEKMIRSKKPARRAVKRQLSLRKNIKIEEVSKPQIESKSFDPAQDKQRRNALDVKKAIDQEIEELQEKEKEWDIPAFLRSKKS